MMIRARGTLRLLILALLLGHPSGASAQRPASAPDPYHPIPSDTVDASTYEGWKRYRLLCDRCHGEEARGTTFGPDLLPALSPDGSVPSQEAFIALMHCGRPEKGMPPAERLGLSEEYYVGLYQYLHGRSTGRYAGGRPARRED
jgi:hypothetical protein